MAGDLRDLKAKLLEARKAEKKPQAVSQKQDRITVFDLF
jgi:ATP-dependent helicase HrpA